MGEETVSKDAAESLEEMSGEWMRQQLQNAELAPPPPASAAPSPDSGEQAADEPPQTVAPGPPPPAAPTLPTEEPRSAESALDSSIAAATQLAPSTEPAPVSTSPVPPAQPPPAPLPAAGPEKDTVLADLASSVSHAVVGAVTNLEKHRAAQTQDIQNAIRHHDEQLRGVLERLTAVQQKLDEFARFASEHKSWAVSAGEKHDHLATEVESLRQSDASREASLEELRRETLDLSVSVSDRQDQMIGRLELQQADLAELKAGVGEVSPKLNAAVERIERQARALRSIFEAEKRREAALEQLNEAATNLKASVSQYPEGLSEELL